MLHGVLRFKDVEVRTNGVNGNITATGDEGGEQSLRGDVFIDSSGYFDAIAG
jgi:hypothetical protein